MAVKDSCRVEYGSFIGCGITLYGVRLANVRGASWQKKVWVYARLSPWSRC